jgi:hypothetical protein
LRNTKKIIFYSDRKDVDHGFGIKDIFKDVSFSIEGKLKYVAKKSGSKLIVVGRTNISWFENTEERRKLYENALKKGCIIKFIIQHGSIDNNIEVDDKVKEERKKTIEGFKKMHMDLKNRGCPVDENLKLSLIAIPIDNSITAIYKGIYYNYFSYDIGLNIENEKNPFLIFYKDSVLSVLKNKLMEIEEKSVDIFEYDERFKEATAKVDEIIKEYTQHSEQRNNNSEKIMFHYFLLILYRRNSFIRLPNFSQASMKRPRNKYLRKIKHVFLASRTIGNLKIALLKYSYVLHILNNHLLLL